MIRLGSPLGNHDQAGNFPPKKGSRIQAEEAVTGLTRKSKSPFKSEGALLFCFTESRWNSWVIIHPKYFAIRDEFPGGRKFLWFVQMIR